MNNTRYTLTFYGGLWLAAFVIFWLKTDWSWPWLILAGFLVMLCPSWKHYFDWKLTKALAKKHMEGHMAEHNANLKRDEERGIKH